MEPWYKFILYGTYDGFSRSTLGDDNLYLILENGEKVEIPRCFVKNASDFVEKDKLKLKDVIARIKDFDSGTQIVWLDAILNELGSDYGILKYKTGYEQGRFEGEYVGQQLKDADKVRQELNKPTVPQIIADYIKYTKDAEWDLQEAMDDVAYEDNKDLRKWFNNNIELFARAWIDGYTVEKEPKYTVKFKATKQYLCNDDLGPHFDPSFRTNFTKSDLEKLDLGWVFDCEGMEVEKVGK